MTYLNQKTVKELGNPNGFTITDRPELNDAFDQAALLSEMIKVIKATQSKMIITLEQTPPALVWWYLSLFSQFPHIEVRSSLLSAISERVILAFYVKQIVNMPAGASIYNPCAFQWPQFVQPLTRLVQWAKSVEQTILRIGDLRAYTDSDISEPPSSSDLPIVNATNQHNFQRNVSTNPIVADQHVRMVAPSLYSPGATQFAQPTMTQLPLHTMVRGKMPIASRAMIYSHPERVVGYHVPQSAYTGAIPAPTRVQRLTPLTLPQGMAIPQAQANLYAQSLYNIPTMPNVMRPIPGSNFTYQSLPRYRDIDSAFEYLTNAMTHCMFVGAPTITFELLKQILASDSLEGITLKRVSFNFMEYLLYAITPRKQYTVLLQDVEAQAIAYFMQPEKNHMHIASLYVNYLDDAAATIIADNLQNMQIKILVIGRLDANIALKLIASCCGVVKKLMLDDSDEELLRKAHEYLMSRDDRPQIIPGSLLSSEWRSRLNTLNISAPPESAQRDLNIEPDHDRDEDEEFICFGGKPNEEMRESQRMANSVAKVQRLVVKEPQDTGSQAITLLNRRIFSPTLGELANIYHFMTDPAASDSDMVQMTSTEKISFSDNANMVIDGGNAERQKDIVAKILELERGLPDGKQQVMLRHVKQLCVGKVATIVNKLSKLQAVIFHNTNVPDLVRYINTRNEVLLGFSDLTLRKPVEYPSAVVGVILHKLSAIVVGHVVENITESDQIKIVGFSDIDIGAVEELLEKVNLSQFRVILAANLTSDSFDVLYSAIKALKPLPRLVLGECDEDVYRKFESLYAEDKEKLLCTDRFVEDISEFTANEPPMADDVGLEQQPRIYRSGSTQTLFEPNNDSKKRPSSPEAQPEPKRREIVIESDDESSSDEEDLFGMSFNFNTSNYL